MQHSNFTYCSAGFLYRCRLPVVCYLLSDVVFTGVVRQRCQSCLFPLSNWRASARLGSARLGSLQLTSALLGTAWRNTAGGGVFTEWCAVHVTILFEETVSFVVFFGNISFKLLFATVRMFLLGDRK
jgi:hypothetical protein